MFQKSPAANPAVKVSKYHELAEAMRRGVEVTTPLRRHYFGVNHDACALGAAWIGLGYEVRHDLCSLEIHRTLKREFGQIAPLEEIEQLNDGGVCREDIADWLDAHDELGFPPTWKPY